jgi:hypothetical protein
MPRSHANFSRLTGRPETVNDGKREYLVTGGGASYFDRVEARPGGLLALEGWSEYLIGESGHPEILVFNGERQMRVRARLTPRPDVAGEGKDLTLYSACGYEVLISLDALPPEGSNLWVMSIHESGRAYVLGRYRVALDRILPCRDRVQERFSATLEPGRVDVRSPERDQSLSYERLTGAPSLFESRFGGNNEVRELRAKGRSLFVAGWAASHQSQRPAEAIGVFRSGELLGMVEPNLDRRDVARQVGPLALRSGFEMTIDLPTEPGKDLGAFEVLAFYREGYAVALTHAPS